jgi:hypothetical protein
MNDKHYQITVLLVGFCSLFLLYQFLSPLTIFAEEKISGMVLLPKKNGEAWYINPDNGKRYFLNRPTEAFQIMRKQGIGATDENLSRIQPSTLHLSGEDSDNDGLPDAFEKAVGTDPDQPDTDKDGYDDKQELENGYNPAGGDKLNYDKNFADKHQGKILLQTEKNGEAWYIADQRRYFLGRPLDAFEIMKNLSLGLTEDTLDKISIPAISQNSENKEKESIEEVTNKDENIENSCGYECTSTKGAETARYAIKKAAAAIRKGDTEKTLNYFTEEMEEAVSYTVDFLDEEGRNTLANILAGSELSHSQIDTRVYTNQINFDQDDIEIDFEVVKKQNGRWFMANL